MSDNFRKHKSMFIPFVTTKPGTDLGLLIGLVPIWWVVGLEQIIWPFALFFIAVKVILIKQGKVRINNVMVLFFVFLVSQVFSFFAIDETYRILVFLRNFAIFLSALLLLFIVTNSIIHWKEVKNLLRIVLLSLAFSAFLGLLGILNIWRPDFVSPLASVFPDWITNNQHGEKLVVREIGQIATFLSFSYFRLHGIFYYPTSYGTILSTFIPVSIFLIFQSRRLIGKILYCTLSLLLLVNLIYTTGRGAMLSLIIGFVLFQLFSLRRHKTVRWIMILTFFFLVIIIVFLNENVLNAVYSFFSVRSTNSRINEYLLSLQWWLQRPFFGWGVALSSEVEGISRLPLGSHSYYIAILFRFGLIGLIGFISVYWVLWKHIHPIFLNGIENDNGFLDSFLKYGQWVFFVLLLDGITTVQITDGLSFVFSWLILSLLVVSRNIIILQKQTQ